MKHNKFTILDIIIYVILIIFGISVFVPFWHILVISFSTKEGYLNDIYHIFPKSFSLNAYTRAFSSIGGLVRAFNVSVQITVLGTTLSMFLSTIGAYALSKKYLPGRDIIFRLLVITMFFSGGLVPFYIVVSKLQLKDTIFALTIPLAINTFNLIVMKNYFASLPESLEESAKIDGYNDVQILYKIIIPIAKPVFAAICLFYAVAYWNDYFMATLFISSTKMNPLQVFLRELIISNSVAAQMGITTSNDTNAEQFKMACIIIGILPMLIMYPFTQKYFSKGLMLGAVKE